MITLFVKMKFGEYVFTPDIPFTVKQTPVAKVKREKQEKQAEKLFELVKK